MPLQEAHVLGTMATDPLVRVVHVPVTPPQWVVPLPITPPQQELVTVAKFCLRPVPLHARASLYHCIAQSSAGIMRRASGVWLCRHPLQHAWQCAANAHVQPVHSGQ